MEKEELRDYFKTISAEYYTITVEDYKIFFKYSPFIKKAFSVIISILLTLAYFYVAKNYFITNQIVSHGRHVFSMGHVYLTSIGVFIASLIGLLTNLMYFKVIDLDNKQIYNETHYFSFTIKTTFKDILQVGNNITPTFSRSKTQGYRATQKLEPDPETNLFYTYSVNFLKKDGKSENIIIGPHEMDYETSVTMAKNISEYFNIPLVTCNKGNILTTREYFNSYKFEEKQYNISNKQ